MLTSYGGSRFSKCCSDNFLRCKISLETGPPLCLDLVTILQRVYVCSFCFILIFLIWLGLVWLSWFGFRWMWALLSTNKRMLLKLEELWSQDLYCRCWWQLALLAWHKVGIWNMFVSFSLSVPHCIFLEGGHYS